MTYLKFKPAIEVIQGGYFISSQSTDNKIEMTFKNVFPNGIISNYTVYVTFEVGREVVNADNSIDITINGIKYVKLVQKPTGVTPSGKDDLTYMAELIEDDGKKSIINKPSKMSENLTLEYTNPNPNRKRSYHVEAGQSVAIAVTQFMHFYNKCPAGSDEFNVVLGKGDSLTNPLDWFYRPMAIFKNNGFNTIDHWGSFISRMNNGNWDDISQEKRGQQGQLNIGKNRIFKDGGFRQQSRIGRNW